MNLFIFCAISALSLHDTTLSIKFQKQAAVNDLVFTEILADPDPPVGLPTGEFCEIFNRSATAIDLSGWTFYDGSIRALPQVIIDPGEYVIICNDDDTALFAIFGKCAAVSSISLTNSGEKISLRDPSGNPTDSVIFSDTWLGSSYKKDGGWSLEKIDVDFNCPVSSNWKVSENSNGGTPGTLNSVNGIIADTDAPVLIRGYCKDSNSVVLIFNEALDPISALAYQNYLLLPSSNPSSVFFEDEFLKRILITFNTIIPAGIIHTIQVSNVTDCSGNEIAPGSTTRVAIPDSVYSSGLIINEILFNPFEGGSDFVELYNCGKSIFDLSEFYISGINSETGLINETEKITEEHFLMFPEDYIIITENAFAVAAQYKSSYPYNFIETGNLPSMNVDEGNVIISRQDKILDNFHYLENYHFELIEDPKGISLEKINPYFSSSDPASWHSAAETFGYSTPGLKNSQYSEIVKSENEVLLSPEIFSPDNDGLDDVVNISLHTDKPGYISNIWIYSSNGIVVHDNAKNKLLATGDSFSWDGITEFNTRAPAGIYIAYVQVFHLNGNEKHYRLPFVLAIKP